MKVGRWKGFGVLSCFVLWTLPTYLNIMLNSFRASSVTPVVFLEGRRSSLAEEVAVNQPDPNSRLSQGFSLHCLGSGHMLEEP